METLTATVLLDGLVFGEGPRWHDGRLWFSDMHARTVMTVDLHGRAQRVVAVPGRPSGLGFLPDGRLLVVSVGERRLLRLDPEELHEVADLSALVAGEPNDMVVDAQGRAYIGDTGAPPMGGPIDAAPVKPANIVLVTPDGNARIVAEGLAVPNGLAIHPNGQTLVTAESGANRLTAFTIRPDGSLASRRTFAQFDRHTPDGICVDAEGAVWVGGLFAKEFVRVRDGGEVTHRVPTPEKWAVACTLGGDDRRTLFLMTAQAKMRSLWQHGTATAWIETVRVDVPGAGWP